MQGTVKKGGLVLVFSIFLILRIDKEVHGPGSTDLNELFSRKGRQGPDSAKATPGGRNGPGWRISVVDPGWALSFILPYIWS